MVAESKWEARLRAMKERQEVLRKQPSQVTRLWARPEREPPLSSCACVPTQDGDEPGAKSQSLTVGSSSTLLLAPIPSSGETGPGERTKKRGSISRLSALFGSSFSEEKQRRKEEKEKEKHDRQQLRKERAKTFDVTRHQITKEDIASGGKYE